MNAVSAAGARQSFVLLDGNGRAFLGLPNIDNRGRVYMAQVPEHDEIYRLSGKWATEDFGAAKLLGLRMQHPEQYEAVESVLSLSEWIAWIFTGRKVMEYTQACESQLYDIGQRSWSQTLCSFYGLRPEFLPPLQAAGTAVGPILDTYRRELGMAKDAVVCAGRRGYADRPAANGHPPRAASPWSPAPPRRWWRNWSSFSMTRPSASGRTRDWGRRAIRWR